MAKNKSAKELKRELKDLSSKLTKLTKQRTRQSESHEKAMNKLSDKIHNTEVDINRKTAKLAEAELRETKTKEKEKGKKKPNKLVNPPPVVPVSTPVSPPPAPVVAVSASKPVKVAKKPDTVTNVSAAPAVVPTVSTDKKPSRKK